MWRRRFVLFISRNRKKIIILLKACLVLLGISFIATIMISTVLKYELFTSKKEAENIILEQQETIIYGENIEDDEYTSDEKIISDFIMYCNSGDIKAAYDILSDDCKNKYYSTENEFKQLYHEQIFYTEKLFEMQSWISNEDKNTYKIKLINDLFDLGKYNDSEYLEDYYTVVTRNNEKKLSINKYIENIEINKTDEISGLKITALSKDVFMEYEIYNIEVSNNTGDDIKLDSKETTSGIYLLDTNKVRYSSFIYELVESDLLLKSRQSKKISIKFNKMYNPNITIKSMEFVDIRKGNNMFNMSVDLQ